jgi:hypothetical protein
MKRFTGNGVKVGILEDGVNFSPAPIQHKALPRGGTGRPCQLQYFLSAAWKPTDCHGTLNHPENWKLVPTLRRDEWQTLIPIGDDQIDSPKQWKIPCFDAKSELYSSGDHGMGMALILAGDENPDRQIGVAPGVNILPLQDHFFDSGWSTVLRAASLGVSIISLSQYGITMNRFAPHGFVPSSARDLTVVAIAGNGENTPTDLEKGKKPTHLNLIVTVGVDEQGHLTSESRSCGETKDFCVAAPSHGPTSPTAPIVSGTLALLQQAFPGLPGKTYVDAILKTATLLDAPELTGRGLVNAEKAYLYLERQAKRPPKPPVPSEAPQTHLDSEETPLASWDLLFGPGINTYLLRDDLVNQRLFLVYRPTP